MREPATEDWCNSVSQGMVIDYGEYSIRAKLDDIEPLPRPSC